MGDLQDRAYLGDGVYVGHDGYNIWLAVTRDGRPEQVALEPAVFAELVAYERRLRAIYAPSEEVEESGC